MEDTIYEKKFYSILRDLALLQKCQLFQLKTYINIYKYTILIDSYTLYLCKNHK